MCEMTISQVSKNMKGSTRMLRNYGQINLVKSKGMYIEFMIKMQFLELNKLYFYVS